MSWYLVWLQLSWPIPGAITLTGGFGEMRGQTMHMGIDLSVGERIGEVPVLAAGDGYVYRIRVSHSGFGKVIYVRHPQGLITVYGHLSHFCPKGERIVETLQTAQRRFEVEKFLRPDEWQVRRGDTLGWAGNSGYSFGPHLHFEVRTLREEPLPPLRYLPTMQDTEPPVFFRLGLYPLEPEAQIEGQGGRFFLRIRQVSSSARERLYLCPDTIRVSGRIGFLYTAADKAGKGTAWLGLRSISLLSSSGPPLYRAQWETLDFDWRRFLRWHLDYAYQQVYRIGVGRLYEPSATLPWSQGSGVVAVPPGQSLALVIQAEDFAGNRSEVRVVLFGDTIKRPKRRLPLHPRETWSVEEGLLLVKQTLFTPQGDTVSPERPLRLAGRVVDTLRSADGKKVATGMRACAFPGIEQDICLWEGCTLRLHKESLQDTLYLRIEQVHTIVGKGFLIGDPYVPLRFPAELVWRVPDTVRAEKSYPLFRPWYETVWSPVQGSKRMGRLWRLPVRSWGAYALMEDNTAPQIRPLKAAGPFYLVSVQDFGSGVDPYSFQIYSEKGPLFAEYYEPQRILYLPRKRGRRFTIEVSDRVGNRTRAVVQF